mmetsp:Transcript_26924/g.58587  ORF Transcript_26924/g.58587 Transcript_26924/m.58587 type:complete len:91 (-) Transcript_26924:2393-2665(-)|eukprot:CAMPEP_0206428462 /NCGR_PEP_ID=MMETSP0324_2-20121206/5681_1 /ASSEMBLY_ACC=CAM_ASM_000836 /TAXON_ID=2866 /ORGANISM="Crypthecodinium cohnii, Strain Seligo" /LENGTH=90 /DNA_ID=CAMNT_0053893999 /DNA_START=584 /DNA_END=856 /DNA_ORIENTATION=-
MGLQEHSRRMRRDLVMPDLSETSGRVSRSTTFATAAGCTSTGLTGRPEGSPAARSEETEEALEDGVGEVRPRSRLLRCVLAEAGTGTLSL